MIKNYTIENLKNKALEFGGKCLSKYYGRSNYLYKWKCSNGHIFEKRWNDIINNNKWCPKCRFYITEELCRFIFEQLTNKEFIKTRKIIKGFELDGYCKELNLAFEYNGEQHYKKHSIFHKKSNLEKQKTRDLKIKRECKKIEIKLITIHYRYSKTKEKLEEYIKKQLIKNNIKINSNIDWNEFKLQKNSLKELKEIIKNKGGKLLNCYYSYNYYLKISCKVGHEWSIKPSNLKMGRWCPYCSNRKVCKDNCLATISPKLASEWHPTLNGDLTPYDVVPRFKNKVWWLCSLCGDEWKASGDKRYGRKRFFGCPKCNRKILGNNTRLKDGLNQILEIVEKKHGKLLDNEYVRSDIKMNFICQYGHIFKKDLEHLKRGQWCNQCNSSIFKKYLNNKNRNNNYE